MRAIGRGMVAWGVATPRLQVHTTPLELVNLGTETSLESSNLVMTWNAQIAQSLPPVPVMVWPQCGRCCCFCPAGTTATAPLLADVANPLAINVGTLLYLDTHVNWVCECKHAVAIAVLVAVAIAVATGAAACCPLFRARGA